jgi:hypothetical protein
MYEIEITIGKDISRYSPIIDFQKSYILDVIPTEEQIAHLRSFAHQCAKDLSKATRYTDDVRVYVRELEQPSTYESMLEELAAATVGLCEENDWTK